MGNGPEAQLGRAPQARTLSHRIDRQWDRLVETSYEKLPEEDIVRLQWFGMYHDKPKIGTFMMRVKIPSGILSAGGTAHDR